MKPLTGIVLCGGKSSRMLDDKAFITYHQLPQYQHVCQLLKPFCTQVYISCNKSQLQKIDNNYNCLIDEAEFGDNGPMVGLLTAFKKLPECNFLVLACDYPYITHSDIEKLISKRNNTNQVVAYYNNKTNFSEPLLAIYENTSKDFLMPFVRQHNYSLQQFLKTINTVFVEPNDINCLSSFDTPKQRDSFK